MSGNIAIVGPPGSGKSSIGKELGKQLNMAYHEEPFEKCPHDIITDTRLSSIWMVNEHYNRCSKLTGIFDGFAAYTYNVFLCNEGKQLANPYVPTTDQQYENIDLVYAINIDLATLRNRYCY